MAEPIPFPEANFTFTAPAGDKECSELPVFRDQVQAISKWRLTKAEIEEVVRTGTIWLGVMGQGHPPVWLSATYPFVMRQDDRQH